METLLSFVPGLLTDIYHMFAARAEPARCGAPGNRGGFISKVDLIWKFNNRVLLEKIDLSMVDSP